MSDEPGGDPPADKPWSEQIKHAQVGARVPAHVARGVFSTGAVVLEGAHEFVVDFLLRMAKPQQVVARVVMAPDVLRRFVGALQQNIQLYESHFGNQRLKPVTPTPPTPADPPDPPAPVEPGLSEAGPAHSGHEPPGHSGPILAAAGQPSGDENDSGGESSPTPPGGVSVSELYEQLKLSDEMQSGTYANAVMIGHTPAEFSFDFITTFFPRSAVCCRVFMAAGNAPVLLHSLKHAYEQHARKHR